MLADLQMTGRRIANSGWPVSARFAVCEVTSAGTGLCMERPQRIGYTGSRRQEMGLTKHVTATSRPALRLSWCMRRMKIRVPRSVLAWVGQRGLSAYVC